MKKLVALLLTFALLLTCTAVLAEAAEETAEPRIAHYQIRNLTGDAVLVLKLKDNLTGEEISLLNDAVPALGLEEIMYFDLPADPEETDETLSHRFTLTFSNGSEEKVFEFKTLSFENVLIDLLSEDAMTGATPIKFSGKMFQIGKYKIINNTDKALQSVKFIENSKPDDFYQQSLLLNPGEFGVATYAMDPEADGHHALTIEFGFADGSSASFGTLSIEEASLTMDTDTVTGATPFKFGPFGE